MRSVSPCKGCKDRKVNCHAGCGHYLKWKKENEKINKRIRAAKERHWETWKS